MYLFDWKYAQIFEKNSNKRNNMILEIYSNDYIMQYTGNKMLNKINFVFYH